MAASHLVSTIAVAYIKGDKSDRISAWLWAVARGQCAIPENSVAAKSGCSEGNKALGGVFRVPGERKKPGPQICGQEKPLDGSLLSGDDFC